MTQYNNDFVDVSQCLEDCYIAVILAKVNCEFEKSAQMSHLCRFHPFGVQTCWGGCLPPLSPPTTERPEDMPSDLVVLWSGGLDSNQRPLDPQTKTVNLTVPSTCEFISKHVTFPLTF